MTYLQNYKTPIIYIKIQSFMPERYLRVQLTSWANCTNYKDMFSFKLFWKVKTTCFVFVSFIEIHSVNSEILNLNFERPIQNFNISDVMHTCSR